MFMKITCLSRVSAGLSPPGPSAPQCRHIALGSARGDFIRAGLRSGLRWTWEIRGISSLDGSMHPAGSVDSAHAQVFHFQVLVNAVTGALTADAGLLDTAKRRDLVGDDPRIDAHDPVFQGF